MLKILSLKRIEKSRKNVLQKVIGVSVRIIFTFKNGLLNSF